ncbi:MAG: bacteriohemerythrin [Desulfosporosinus sp.]|nr:bacteriohemerythrin [Desulfosporosinus sp.]
MPICAWDIKYSVGIDKIDKQHQKLVLLLNTVYDTMKDGNGQDRLEQILNELVEYTDYHFKYEEELFERYSYLDKTTHIKEHKDLREKVINFKDNIQLGEGVVTQEILKFLIDWLVKHVLISDKEYSQHLSAKMNL